MLVQWRYQLGRIQVRVDRGTRGMVVLGVAKWSNSGHLLISNEEWFTLNHMDGHSGTRTRDWHWRKLIKPEK